MSDFTLTIDGKAVAGAGKFGVINPATGEVFAEAPDASRAQLDDAMASAKAALRPWQGDIELRRKALRDCAAAIKAKAAELAPILVREQGKPMKDAFGEVIGAAVWFEFTANLQIPVEVIADTPENRIEVRRRPLGVVAAITPWNYPLLLAVWKIAPALLAGNTVVIKPSPFTPLTTLALGALLRDVLPPGVLNVVSGGDGLGAWMTSHPVPRKISFTGSTETGKLVAAAAAPDLKRITLELGGNDAAIVLDDVAVDAVAEKLIAGAFMNCGQVCSAIKRVYVPEKLYSPLVERMATLAKGIKVGDGFTEGVTMGPLNNKPQFERVSMLVDDAKKNGARIAAGGAPVGGKGYFYQPTIVADVAEGVRLVDEEQFGPALPILSYRNLDDAVERANRTNYGLSGSVWSNDPARGLDVASRLDCGTAWVNQHLALVPFAPFGGAKWSGIGVENGTWGLLGFTEIQTVNVAKKPAGS
jgi:acyl-CoA reductase-like NAD-dependent aldehyde dehydrogenase